MGEDNWCNSGEIWWARKRNRPEGACSCSRSYEGNFERSQPTGSEERRASYYKLVPTYVLPNLLKRPATLPLGGISKNKRAQLEEEDADSTQQKTAVLLISKVLNEAYPRSGKQTLENRQSCILTWDNKATGALDSIGTTPNRTVRKKAEELAYLLNVGASGDAVQAAATLVRMLNQADMILIRQNVRCMLGVEYLELNVDKVITDGLVKLIRHHPTKGQQSKDVQNAIDATLTAACFAFLPGEEASLHNIASRILGLDKASGKLTRHKQSIRNDSIASILHPK
jgi:hypothetical protein